MPVSRKTIISNNFFRGKISKSLAFLATGALFFSFPWQAIAQNADVLTQPSKKKAETSRRAANPKIEVSTEKRDNSRTWIIARTKILAPPRIVWETVHEERQHDPDLAYSKILEQGENTCRLEQKFVLLPVIGAAVCEMQNSEVPLERIDYKLIRSDRFKAMEGSWVLSPADNGKNTILELSTHIDLGIPIPAHFTTSATKKKLARRLENVRKMAEQTHSRIAAKKDKAAQ